MSMQVYQDEALHHPALTHPYLTAIANGDFKNYKLILTDFASQYGYYSSWFQKYLTALISKLEDPGDRQLLLNNLQEEQGMIDQEDLDQIENIGIQKEWIEGVPHPLLFKRFQESIGVKNSVMGLEVQSWRDSIMWLMHNGSPEMALGALGLGTEFIVKHIYKYIVQGIKDHTDLKLYDYVFFLLHMEVDDEHGKIMLDITDNIATNSIKSAMHTRYGMLFSLEMRRVFFDHMLFRARSLDI